MLFNSLPFVLLALATFFAWCGSRGTTRLTILLVASYLFYGSWNPLYLPLLLYSTVLDYQVSKWMDRTESAWARRLLLATSLVGNLGVLVYFKYWDFLLSNLGLSAAPARLQTFHVYGSIPPGLSFYTFQTLSHTLDVYRRRSPACRSLSAFALYVAFFPQLVAGPILRSHEFLPQLARDRTPSPAEVTQALELFLVGLFKKVVVADNLGLIVDRVYREPWALSGAGVGLVGLFFWAQVYCDFSGYSTMARGLGRLFGYDLPRNFDAPLLATDPLAYRRSWHITMSEWFRDYVFHPLGGTRLGPWRAAFNILLTWGLFGLWHGAAWTFVLWGFYNGAIQAANRERLRRGLLVPAFPGRAVAGWLLNLAFCVPSALVFRAASLGQGFGLASRLFTLAPGVPAPALWWGIAFVLGGLHLLSRRAYREDLLQRLPAWGQVAALAGLTAIVVLGAAGQRPFVYFQF